MTLKYLQLQKAVEDSFVLMAAVAHSDYAVADLACGFCGSSPPPLPQKDALAPTFQ